MTVMTSPETYRKKPVVIQAIQFAPEGEPVKESWKAVEAFTNNLVHYTEAEDDFDWETYAVYDRLHDTWVGFKRGDWIVRGVQGEFYPVVDDIFIQTYELVP